MASLLLIINRRSRYGLSELDATVRRFEVHGFAVRRFDSQSPAEAVLLLRRHCRVADVVVVGGGDGTLNQLAAALRHCGRPVGLLPLGTANDLAHSLAIPTDLAAAADVIAAGHTRRVDYGEANGVPFFNAANIGLGTRVDEELSVEEKRRWGLFGYVRALRRAWRGNRPFRAEVLCDRHYRRAPLIHLVVGNGRRHGGGILIHPEAQPTDGLLHLYGLRPQPWWRLLVTGGRLRRGIPPGPATLQARCREVRVRTVPTLPVAADGEMITHTPVDFRVVTGALALFVPEGEG